MIIYKKRKYVLFSTIKQVIFWFLCVAALAALYYSALDEKDGYAQQWVAIIFGLVLFYYGARWICRKFPSSPYSKFNLLKNGIRTNGEIVSYAYTYPSNRVTGFKFEFFDEYGNKHIGILGKEALSLKLEVGSFVEIAYLRKSPKIHGIIIS